MDYYKNGTLFIGDITEYGFKVPLLWQMHAPLEVFSCDYAKVINDYGQGFGGNEPATMELCFTVRSNHELRVIYNAAYNNEPMNFSILFHADLNITKTKVTGYKDGIVVEAYIVHFEETFKSGKKSTFLGELLNLSGDGESSSSQIRVKLLVLKLKHITDMEGNLKAYLDFVGYQRNVLKPGKDESTLTLTVLDSRGEAIISVTSGAKSKMSEMTTPDGYAWTISPKRISLTKTAGRPHVIRARLHFFARYGAQEILTRQLFENLFRNRKVILADGENIICNDYYVEKAIPTYEGENLYIDLVIYSPDHKMTMKMQSGSFVAMKLSDLASGLAGLFRLPYSANKHITCGDIAGRLKHLVSNGQEHILPYSVIYNESIYDFLCRTANRWGEFMYYEDGKLNFGYDSDATKAVTVVVASPDMKVDEKVKVCSSVVYCDGDDSPESIDSATNLSLEAAQEFLDNILIKDEYEVPLNEIDAQDYSGRGYDKHILNILGKAFTSGGYIPSQIADNLTVDLISYGQAKKYTDQLRADFNNDYFENPKKGIPKKYDTLYQKENDAAKVYNEFTEIDYKDFMDYDVKKYPEVLAQELSRGRYTIRMNFDTQNPQLKLGDMIELGEKSGEYYMVTEVSCEAEQSRPKWQVKAVRHSGTHQTEADGKTITHVDFYPPYLPSGHTRKAGLQKATVTDVDDPMRRNRVRVKMDWQEAGSDMTPWLTVAQNGAAPGTVSHVRHHKGERVLVDFIGGNVERPFVTGAIQQQSPQKEKWDSPVLTALKTPQGQSILMGDGTGDGLTGFRTAMGPGLTAMQSMAPEISPMSQLGFWQDETKAKNRRFEGSVEIRDYYNTYNIKGSSNDRRVSINSNWGQVDMNAFTGINLNAPNGNVRIMGKNVTIKAGNNLKLVSGTNIKAIKNMLLPEAGAMASGDDWAAEAAAKVLYAYDEKGPIDFKMLRHVRDMFMKPVEGVLEVQSNRYLKLEADGRKAETPQLTYKKEETKAIGEISEEAWYQQGKAIAQLIENMWKMFEMYYLAYTDFFQNAVDVKSQYENAVRELADWSELTENLRDVNNAGVCSLYSALKSTDKFKSEGTTSFEDDDMGFTDLVGVEDGSATTQCENRKKIKRSDVINGRQEARKKVKAAAKDLYDAVQDIKSCKFDTSKLDTESNIVGPDPSRFLPKDYMTAVKNALTKDNLSSISPNLYGIMTSLDEVDLESDTYKDLASPNKADTRDMLTALKHLIGLNLLEELGFKANDEEKKLSELVSSQDDLTGTNWNTTAGKIVFKYDSDDTTIPLRKKKVSEKELWSNGQKGQILITSGESTYIMGRETKLVERMPEEVKTRQLIQNLADPIKRALGVGIANEIVVGGGLQVEIEEEKNARKAARQDGYPKHSEDFVVDEKQDADKKESENQNAEASQENQQKEQNAEEAQAEAQNQNQENENQNQEGQNQENQNENQENQNEGGNNEEEQEAVNTQPQEEEDPEALYHLGDIVTYEGRYYVCVTNHKKDEKARFITLNDQQERIRDSKKYLKGFWFSDLKGQVDPDYDKVYNTDMASAETLKYWVRNVLLDDEMQQTLRSRMKKAGKSVNQIVPETKAINKDLISCMSDANQFVLNCRLAFDYNSIGDADFHMEKHRWKYLRRYHLDGGEEFDRDTMNVVLNAPVGYLLADKMRYHMPNIHEPRKRWVPYIFLAKSDNWELFQFCIDQTENNEQGTTPSHFQWEDMGEVTYNNTNYHIVKVAIFWEHDVYQLDPDDNLTAQAMILDFTKNLSYHPALSEDDSEKTAKAVEQAVAHPEYWSNRNITSREFVFKDTGKKNKKLNHIWVKKERGEMAEENQAEQEVQEVKAKYSLGDIVTYNGHYYVCVSKHEQGGQAQFVTLNNQDVHANRTKKIPFKELGRISRNYDEVYTGDMASAETMTNWVKNILLSDDMNQKLISRMNNAGATESTRQIVPEREEVRQEFISRMNNGDQFLLSTVRMIGGVCTDKYNIVGFDTGELLKEADESKYKYIDDVLQNEYSNTDVMLTLPVGFLLVDKMQCDTEVKPETIWVPYLWLARSDQWNDYVYELNREENEQSTSPKYFEWEDMGKVTYKNKEYHLIKAAVSWYHEYIQVNLVAKIALIDFTKEDKTHSEYDDSWKIRSVTSNEYVFEDTGEKNEKLTHIYVASENE